MCGGGGGELGGIGPGDEVFCSMRFLVSIDHGGRRRLTSSCQKAGVQGYLNQYWWHEHQPCHKMALNAIFDQFLCWDKP